MTKRWSSTRSLDGQTKRQASKKARRTAWPDVTREQIEAIDKLVAPEFAAGDWQTIEAERWDRKT